MTNELKPLDENAIPTPETQVKIYSKGAIWAFSVLFTSVFGGVLLYHNLKDIGKRKEANFVLILSIILTVVTLIIVNIPERPKTSLTFLCNIGAALILTENYFKKYFPNPDEYEKKKIWKPLLISIAITIPFILAVIFGGNLE